MIDEPKTEGIGAGAADVVAEVPPDTGSAQFEIGHGSAIPADELARLRDEIVVALKTVYDPEIPADIYELGLIYKVDVDDDRVVKVEMTLTPRIVPPRRSCRRWWKTQWQACRACARPRSILSGIRRGIQAACRTRRARCSTCGELRAGC
jgi:Iron-sulfur cluster assembly protein